MFADAAAYKPVFITLIIGFFGAGIAAFAQLPAAALVGASISVSIAALCRVKTIIPDRLRNVAFSIVGCSLGSGITKEALSHAVDWPLSFLLLAVAVCVIIMVGSLLLTRFCSLTPETAVLATAPGAVSYILALSAGGIGDIRTVMVIQNIRIVLLATLLPFIIRQAGFDPGQIHAPISSSFLSSFIVISLSLVIGICIERWHLPASFLIAGMLTSGLGHYLDLVSGLPPFPVTFFAFTVTGSLVGARFSPITHTDLKSLLFASLGGTLIAGLLAAGFAYPVALWLNISFGQAFISFTPGGIEAMAAMAVALGYDPAFVASHHLFRILFLFIIVPLSIKLVRRIDRGR